MWPGPALLAFAAAGRRGRPHGLGAAWTAAAVTGVVLFLVFPRWWIPHGGDTELHLAFWQQALAASYIVFAAGVLLLSAREELTSTRVSAGLGEPRRTRPRPAPAASAAS